VKLNHLNLSVSDVPAAKRFLITYFDLQDLGDGNKNMAFLRDDSGLILSMFKGKDIKYPGTFHIGFIQPSEAKVDEINARMKADGIDVPAPQRLHAWTFYVKAPGGFTVEVLC
jgi:lactoylglutathione lyase